MENADFDKIVDNSKRKRTIYEEYQLKKFVSIHEYNKKGISENDQFHMVMALLNCAYQNEINSAFSKNKTSDEINQIKEKWKYRRMYIKNVWDYALIDKYQTVMREISIMSIWNDKYNNTDNNTDTSKIEENNTGKMSVIELEDELENEIVEIKENKDKSFSVFMEEYKILKQESVILENL
jgi:hypothetical protein